MTQGQCLNCNSRLAAGDAFCGVCGMAASSAQRGAPPKTDFHHVSAAVPTNGWDDIRWADGGSQAADSYAAPAAEGSRATTPAEASHTAWGQVRPEPRPDEPPGQFFSHAHPRQSEPPSNTTRFLCAAAYLNPAYANRVIKELVASRRAVAPSLGIDLVPIIRHCLNARNAQLLRDLALTVLVVLGLYLATVPVLAILAISLCLTFLPGAGWERRSLGVKAFAGAAIVVVVAVVIIYFLLGSIASGANGDTTPNLGPLATGFSIILVVLAFLVLVGLTLGSYSYSMYRTFSDRLGPESDAGRFDRASSEVEARISEIGAAQRGNMTVYGSGNPFVGTGGRIPGGEWSIAIELDRAPRPGQAGPRGHRSNNYVPIDPAELHEKIRARLLKVKDGTLPANERISTLSVHDHVVGDGNCRWDSPIIDQERATPYSQASPEAIDALIRHPAAGLRYYLRVCISDEGQPVWARQHEIIGSTDQEIAVSAFVYVAVEGRMLYLQFVPYLLSPIHESYHLVDRLPRITSGDFMLKVILHAARSSFGDIIRAPFGLMGTLSRIAAERWAHNSEFTSMNDYVYADAGAQISVRELGSSTAARNHIQRLDTAKYVKIVQRLILDTVLDFLKEKDVDTSAYTESASAIITNYTIHGNVGAMATGSHGNAEGHVHAGASAGSGGPRP